MKIDELILELKNIRENQGNVDISIYDRNKEKTYPIEKLGNDNIEIDTSTKVEKLVYSIVDKHEVKNIQLYDYEIDVELKNGEGKRIQYLHL